ncbi:DUF4177 domain-containing protein [Aquimarina mytili]|uniref:DUF4177 domain-containing protein n=1 Tax=Aquimarina mytili TaxID=874423 RepID=A0A937D781_9FLAO|nr:DUF4177 domain-containing protein [Aquimarina mytili]MBL0682825.1 DUF4177 domain-containing protein [Aquimarina mytili]
MEYKVVPFVASIGNKGTSNQAANQLEDLIQNHANQGWKYVRLESLITFVQPESGCFGFGARPGYTTSRQMIVFSK